MTFTLICHNSKTTHIKTTGVLDSPLFSGFSSMAPLDLWIRAEVYVIGMLAASLILLFCPVHPMDARSKTLKCFFNSSGSFVSAYNVIFDVPSAIHIIIIIIMRL